MTKFAAPLFVLAGFVLGAGSGASPAERGMLLAVESASMEPTVRCAAAPGCSRLNPDRVVVTPIGKRRPIARHSIVVIDRSDGSAICRSEKLLVKRVIAVPGDRLALRNGAVYINGGRLSELYLRRHTYTRGRARTELRRREYFVMGDNRRMSCDSRDFGPVDRTGILGIVTAIEPGSG